MILSAYYLKGHKMTVHSPELFKMKETGKTSKNLKIKKCKELILKRIN